LGEGRRSQKNIGKYKVGLLVCRFKHMNEDKYTSKGKKRGNEGRDSGRKDTTTGGDH